MSLRDFYNPGSGGGGGGPESDPVYGIDKPQVAFKNVTNTFTTSQIIEGQLIAETDVITEGKVILRQADGTTIGLIQNFMKHLWFRADDGGYYFTGLNGSGPVSFLLRKYASFSHPRLDASHYAEILDRTSFATDTEMDAGTDDLKVATVNQLIAKPVTTVAEMTVTGRQYDLTADDGGATAGLYFVRSNGTPTQIAAW